MIFNQNSVRRLVLQQFPELPCDKVEKLGEGMDSSAWLIDGRCVFRFPKRETGAECLQNEIRVLPQIVGRLSVRITAPHWIGTPTSGFVWRFAGYELIGGRSACDASITDSAAPEFARSLARFLKTLHSISATEARESGAPTDEWRRLEVAYRCDFARERLRQAESLGLIPNASTWQSRLDEIESASPVAEPKSLVHGDLYSKHVLIDDDFQLTGIIDWGDVHIGHPAVDLAAAWNTVSEAGRAAFLAEYGPIDEATGLMAQLRAIYHSAATLLFAVEIGDQPLAAHSRSALQAVLSESGAG